MNFLKWLYPGMHIKRWLLLLMIGIVIVSLGVGYFLREVYYSYTFPSLVYYLTLQFLPRPVRGALFLAGGIIAIVIAIVQLNKSLLSVLLPPGRDDSLVDIVYAHRLLRRGPKVVAVGGGTGLSTLLRGLKEYTSNITAIVTVADDGGSSGRLRRELGVLPPGDFRNCIAALADAEPLMERLLQYRFDGGTGLEGHSFGNLFLVAMSDITGNFERALRETSRVLAVRGQVLPSTLSNVTLCAETQDGEVVRGESVIGHLEKPIKRLYLEPEASAHPDAIRAILQADLIVLGPGSLYTSVLPNLLVEGIRKAIRASSAVKVYVCNVATQPGETDGYDVGDHVSALIRHGGPGLFQYVLANSNVSGTTPGRTRPVVLNDQEHLAGIDVVLADVVDEDNRVRHHPQKLAESLMRLYYDKAPLRSSARRREPTRELSGGVQH